jgi:hypothetical protein
MVRTAFAMALGLGALMAGPVVFTGPLAPGARAETPRQEFLEHHPRVAAARADEWRENHPYWDWRFYHPVDRVVVDPPVVVDPYVPVVRRFLPWWRR